MGYLSLHMRDMMIWVITFPTNFPVVISPYMVLLGLILKSPQNMYGIFLENCWTTLDANEQCINITDGDLYILGI